MCPFIENDGIPGTDMPDRVFRQRSGPLVTVVCLLSGLLLVLALAALLGPGFDRGSNDPLWALVLGFLLLVPIGAFIWLLRRRPAVMIVGRSGIDLPLTFRRPLHWDAIHRIRRLRRGALLYGRQEWLIIDPSPGALAPLRLPTWRKLDLWFQSKHGVRIPLHGLDASAEDIVAAIQRFRPVLDEKT